MFLSESTAREVLEFDPPIEHSVSQFLRKMSQNQEGMAVTLKELTEMHFGRSRAAILPLVDIRYAHRKDETYAYLSGMAVLKNGKLAGTLNETEAWGAMWLRNRLDKTTLTVRSPDGTGFVSLQLKKAGFALRPRIEDGRWSLEVRIETKAEIAENTSKLDLSSPDHLGRVERAAEEEMDGILRQTLRKTLKELNADIFHFADAFYRKYPKEWSRNRDRLDVIG